MAYNIKGNIFAYRTRRGYFGPFGGKFIPEILQSAFDKLIEAFTKLRADPGFWKEFISLLSEYSCRPTPVTYAENLSEALGGARIYLKREDLNQTGAHKLNNVMGQGLLARRMGKTRVIAETGAGQHGVATATMAARFGLQCTIYMGAEDVQRQYPNVFWMRQLGAEVVSVSDGSRTLKDAINEAFRDWVAHPENTHYVLGTACGPYPYPEMVTLFQSVIGAELRSQLRQMGLKPSRLYACVGGGSNAMGMFYEFLDDDIDLVGVEAGGSGGRHAARLASDDGSIGTAQGYTTVFLQNHDGQMLQTSSIAAGLDYVGISPILAYLHQKGRVRFSSADDREIIVAARKLMRTEGIIPALESSHALAGAIREAPTMRRDEIIVVNLSGRGDKDIFTIAEAFEDTSWKEYLRSRTTES